MDKLRKLLEKMKAIAGAEALATEIESAIKEAEVEADTLKGDAAGRKKLEAENKKLAADLLAAAGGADERVTKLTKERDDAVALAAKGSADLRQVKLNTKLAEKLGIADPTRQKRALESFTRDYLPEGIDFDDKGELPGLEKSLKTFREKEAFFFGDPANEGQPQGADPGGVCGAPRKGELSHEDKVSAWEKELGGDTK